MFSSWLVFKTKKKYWKNCVIFVPNSIPRSSNFTLFNALVSEKYLTGTLKLFTFLKNHFFFQDPKIKDRNVTVYPLNRFINSFSNPMLEVYCQFLISVLTSLINLKFLFKRHNPVTDIMYDLLAETLCVLLSCFIQPEFVRKLKAEKIPYLAVRIQRTIFFDW